LLGQLATNLHVQAQQVTFDLALRTSDSGDVRDVFMGTRHFPLLSVGNWLLFDIAQQSHVSELLVIAFLSAVRERAMEVGLLEIAEWSAAQSSRELGRLTADEHAWQVQQEAPEEALVAQPGTGMHARWAAGAVTTAMAAAHRVGVDEEARAQIRTMLSDLAMAFQLLEDLRNLPQDVVDGRRTFATDVALRAAGIETEARLEPYEVLGRLVLADALTEVSKDAAARFGTARDAAQTVGLPTFVAFIDAAQAAVHQRNSLGDARPSIGHAHQPTKSKAIEMAESFLTHDLTFEESWETHREGMLGASLVSSRFPAALILEILCKHGHRLQDPVDAFIARAEANGFRYYEHPYADPDSDTVGAVLRLMRYSSSPSRMSPELTRILDCIDGLAVEGAQIPVWLTACSDLDPERPSTLALGEGCATVACHLLLGLFSFGGGVVRAATAHRAAQALLDRIADVGLGANVNYPPFYALVTYFRLLDAAGSDHAARETLNAELERRCAEPVGGAQDAALAMLAAHAANRPELVSDRWIATILREQRFDGSWMGELFAVAPNRGWRATPYSSTTLSTALCYDALRLGS